MDHDYAATGTFSHLVGLIYDAALDPERWPDALDVRRHHLGVCKPALSLMALPTGRLLVASSVGIPSPRRERMADYAAGLSPDTTNRYAREWGFLR